MRDFVPVRRLTRGKGWRFVLILGGRRGLRYLARYFTGEEAGGGSRREGRGLGHITTARPLTLCLGSFRRARRNPGLCSLPLDFSQSRRRVTAKFRLFCEKRRLAIEV